MNGKRERPFTESTSPQLLLPFVSLSRLTPVILWGLTPWPEQSPHNWLRGRVNRIPSHQGLPSPSGKGASEGFHQSRLGFENLLRAVLTIEGCTDSCSGSEADSILMSLPLHTLIFLSSRVRDWSRSQGPCLFLGSHPMLLFQRDSPVPFLEVVLSFLAISAPGSFIYVRASLWAADGNRF